jgi:hypothetical protein
MEHSPEKLRSLAASMAASLEKSASSAKSEEEIRIAFSKQIGLVENDLQIKLDDRHEYSVANGRIDSVYQRVFIEFKSPCNKSSCITDSISSPGCKALIKQIESRFDTLGEECNFPHHSMLGVGTDGKHFIYIRKYNNAFQITPPVELSTEAVLHFLYSLLNTTRSGKPIVDLYLKEDFGSSSSTARTAINSFYKCLMGKKSPKTEMLYSQWRLQFGEVSGSGEEEVQNNSKHLALIEIYVDDVKDVSFSVLLFSIHTYFAIIMKFLSSAVMSNQHSLPSPLKAVTQAGNKKKFKDAIAALENGGIFKQFNILNYLEGDLYSWYIEEWSQDIESSLKQIANDFDSYNFDTLVDEAEENRDLLKHIYQDLLPREIRHDLGEFYTPDWMAEFTLDQIGYDGDPRKRLLDPSCGSGTFLVLAIHRIISWYKQFGVGEGIQESQVLELILENVTGFDLNPIAVLAARTNFLIAIRRYLKHAAMINIPIYSCDSILSPSGHRDIFSIGEGGKIINTVVKDFCIPIEVTNEQQTLAKYTEGLEDYIVRQKSFDDFETYCDNENIPHTEKLLHEELYQSLVKLHDLGRDGIWARILKNAFAPSVVGQFDFVVGNPPWVNWESLPDHYRKATGRLWQYYNLFQQKGLKARLGGGKDDISVLLTYVAHHRYLKEEGKLGFVITQTLFKTKGGGSGFRRLKYGEVGSEVYFNPFEVWDFSKLKVFDDATNKTAVFISGKSSHKLKFPVKYSVVSKKSKMAFNSSTSWQIVKNCLDFKLYEARPIDDETSPWITSSSQIYAILKKCLGNSPDYRPRKGVYCATNTVYWLTDVTPTPVNSNLVLITNQANSGKKSIDQVQMAVEKDLVFPLLRGKGCSRWQNSDSLHIILPQDRSNPAKAIPLNELQIKYPKAEKYFSKFETIIRDCALLEQFFDSKSDPYYSSYNVGPYTFSKIKVIWKEIASEIEASVTSEAENIIIPDHKLVFVPLESEDEAYYLCGVLNSSPIRVLVRSYANSTSISGHIAEYVRIPKFDSTNLLHTSISHLSKSAHSSTGSQLDVIEKNIDEKAMGLWGMSIRDMATLRQYLSSL